MPDEAPMAYSINEAAALLSCSRDTVERLIERQRIKSVRLTSRRIVIPRAELERFLADEAA